MDSEFIIKIRTALEGQGIKLTDEQFQGLQKTIHEVKESHHNAAEKMGLDHRELRESLGAVGRAFGGLADVGLWLSPVTAALAVVLLLVGKLKEHFQTLNDKIREYIDTSRQIRADHMAALEAATRDTADATAEFARQARAAAESQDSQNAAMENRLALNDAYIDGLKKIEAAEEKAFEAQVERDAASGKISKEEAQRRKDIARERLADDTAGLDFQKEQQRIAEHQRQLSEARDRIPAETAARDAALRDAENPSITAADTKAEIDRQSKILTAQNKKVADSLAEAQQHRTAGTLTRDIDDTADIVAGKPRGTLARASAILAERRAAQDQQIAEQTAAYIRTLQATQDASDQAVKDAKAEAGVQNRKLEKDQQLIDTLPDRIAQEKALAEVNKKNAQRVNHVNQNADIAAEAPPSAAQIAASRETGPEASLGARDAVDKIRMLDAQLRGGRPDAPAMTELHRLLDRIIGYQENPSIRPSQHNELGEMVRSLSARLDHLESQQAVARYGQ